MSIEKLPQKWPDREWPSCGPADSCEGNYPSGEGVYYLNDEDYGCKEGDSAETPHGSGKVVDRGYYSHPNNVCEITITVRLGDGRLIEVDRNDVRVSA